MLDVTPNQQLQLSFAGGCFFAILAALSYVTRAPDVAQLLISVAMFLNVAGAILSRTYGICNFQTNTTSGHYPARLLA